MVQCAGCSFSSNSLLAPTLISGPSLRDSGELDVNTSMMARPEDGEHAQYYQKYISLVPPGNIVAVLETQFDETLSVLSGLTESQAEKHHAPYTWSIKDVVGHLIDSERIFGYRALRFARQDAKELPGFDENDYAVQAVSDARALADLLQEFAHVRQSHLDFFRSLPADAWLRRGVANGDSVTVRALAYIIAGHERHHVGILRKRLTAT
jgi:hypothetical protein